MPKNPQQSQTLRTATLLILVHIGAIGFAWFALGISFGTDSGAFGVALVLCGLLIIFDFFLAVQTFMRNRNKPSRYTYLVVAMLLFIPVVLMTRFVIDKKLAEYQQNKVVSLSAEQLVSDIRACNVLTISEYADYLQVTFYDNHVLPDGKEYSYRNVQVPIGALASAKQAGKDMRDTCTIQFYDTSGKATEL